MKTNHIWANKINRWVVIGLLVLIFVITIALVLIAYFMGRKYDREGFATSNPMPIIDWKMLNEKLVDANNMNRPNPKIIQKAINLPTTNKSTLPEIILKSDIKEFIQILPSRPDTSSDYNFLRPTVVNNGFTISMWVKFPATRNFNISGQSECLVEIFKNGSDGKDGAWKSRGTNWGGYFHIVRRAANNGSNNNKIATGFLGLGVTGPEITDTDWHHIAVTVKLTSLFTNNNPSYEIILYVDDGVPSILNTPITEKDQIFIGSSAEFNIGKFTRATLIENNSINDNNCYANMSLSRVRLFNSVLNSRQISIISSNATNPATTTRLITTTTRPITTTTRPITTTTRPITTTTRPITTTTRPITTTTRPITTTTTLPTTTTTLPITTTTLPTTTTTLPTTTTTLPTTTTTLPTTTTSTITTTNKGGNSEDVLQ